MTKVTCYHCGGIGCDKCSQTGYLNSYNTQQTLSEAKKYDELAKNRKGFDHDNNLLKAFQCYAECGYNDDALRCLTEWYKDEFNEANDSGHQFEGKHILWILKLGEKELKDFFINVMDNFICRDRLFFNHYGNSEHKENIWNAFLGALATKKKFEPYSMNKSFYSLKQSIYYNFHYQPELAIKVLKKIGVNDSILANNLEEIGQFKYAAHFYYQDAKQKKWSPYQAKECYVKALEQLKENKRWDELLKLCEEIPKELNIEIKPYLLNVAQYYKSINMLEKAEAIIKQIIT